MYKSFSCHQRRVIGICYLSRVSTVHMYSSDWLIDWYDTIQALHKSERKGLVQTHKNWGQHVDSMHGKHILRHKTPVSVRNQPYSSIWHQRYMTKSSGRSESTWHRRQCALRGLPIPPWQLIQAKVCPSATCTHRAASRWSRLWGRHHRASSCCIPSEVSRNTH